MSQERGLRAEANPHLEELVALVQTLPITFSAAQQYRQYRDDSFRHKFHSKR